MTIRAVLFDIGGVLSQYSDLKTYLKWEERLGLPPKGLFHILYEGPVSKKATLGEATTDEVWEEVGRQCDLLPDELETMKEEIWSGYEWNTELMEFILSLKPKYKTGVISNAWSGTREGMKDTINNDIFDEIVLSAEEGIQKPDPEIYHRALTQLGIAPGEAIFVDDRERNVEGAREVGMHAVVFTDNAQAIKEIERLLNG